MEPASIGAAAAATSAIFKLIQHVFAYSEVPNDVQAFQSSIESFTATLNTTRRLRRVKSHLLDPREKLEIDANIRRGDEILGTICTTIEACRKDLSSKGTVSMSNRVAWLVKNQHTFMSRTHTLRVCHSNLNCDINGMRLLGAEILLVGKQPPSYDSSQADFGFGIEGTFRPPSSRSSAGSLPRPALASAGYGGIPESRDRSKGSMSSLKDSFWEPSKESAWETSSVLSRETSYDLPTFQPTETSRKPSFQEPPRMPSGSWRRSRESLTAQYFRKAEEAAQEHKQKEKHEWRVNTYELEDTSSWGGSTIMSPSLSSMRSFDRLEPPPPPLPALDAELKLEVCLESAFGDYAIDSDELEDIEPLPIRPPPTARRKVRKSVMIT